MFYNEQIKYLNKISSIMNKWNKISSVMNK